MVNQDVEIDGTLYVDPIGSEVGVGVSCCNEADTSGGGQAVLYGFLHELAFDADEIQSR